MSEDMKLKREALIRKALADLDDCRVDDFTWVVNGKKIRQTRDDDYFLPNHACYGRFQTVDACLLFLLCQMFDPAYTVPAPKYEQESCEYRCMDVEDALQAEIKAIETMDDYGDALQVAIALEAKIDRLVLETWLHPQAANGYKIGRIRSALNVCFNVYYSDEAKEARAANGAAEQGDHESFEKGRSQMKLDLIIYGGIGHEPLKIDLDMVPAFADFTGGRHGLNGQTLLILNGTTVQEFFLRIHTLYSSGAYGIGAIAGTFHRTMHVAATPAAAKGMATRIFNWKDRTPNTKTLRELLQTVIDNNADQIDQIGFQAAEALAAFFIWATTPAPARVEVVHTLPLSRHARYDVLLNGVPLATRLPYSDAYHRAAGIAIKQPGGATLTDCMSPNRPEHFSPVAPAPIIEDALDDMTALIVAGLQRRDDDRPAERVAPEPIIEVEPAGDVNVVGFVTDGTGTDQIRAGLQMLSKTPEGPEKQRILANLGVVPPITKEETNMKDAPTGKGPSPEEIQEALRLWQNELNQNAEAIGEVLVEPLNLVQTEREIRQTLLADLKAAGVTAYLLAVAMLKTEARTSLKPDPIDAQAPSEQQRTVLDRVVYFGRMARETVEETSENMKHFALAHAMHATFQIIGGDPPTGSWVAAGILGRLLQYLTGRDPITIRLELHTWDRLTYRDMTPMETRLYEAYRRLKAAAVADNLKEDR